MTTLAAIPASSRTLLAFALVLLALALTLTPCAGGGTRCADETGTTPGERVEPAPATAVAGAACVRASLSEPRPVRLLAVTSRILPLLI